MKMKKEDREKLYIVVACFGGGVILVLLMPLLFRLLLAL